MLLRREWTDKEIRYLENNYNKYDVAYIAERLHRSKDSIKRKAQRLGYNAYICNDLYLTSVAKSFNSDISVVKRWIKKYDLPCNYIQRGQIKCGLISIKQFWKWADAHRDVIPWIKYERYSILPEPKWLHEVISLPKNKSHRKPITLYEKTFVITERRKGKSFKEIATILNRTEDSIKHIWRNRPFEKEE